MRSSYKIKKRTEFCTLLYANGTLFLTWAPPQTPPSPSTPKGEREGRGNGARVISFVAAAFGHLSINRGERVTVAIKRAEAEPHSLEGMLL